MKTTINAESMWKIDHGPDVDYELSKLFSELDNYFFEVEFCSFVSNDYWNYDVIVS